MPIADSHDGGGSVDVSLAEPQAEVDRIASFIRSATTRADAEGVVVNMSGGLDSTVVVALAVEALGPDRVYGLTLPCNKTGAVHARDAEGLAEALGIEHDTVHLQPVLSQFSGSLPARFDLHDDPVTTGNLVSRLRMTTAYAAANATGGLVLGTTNRSERLLGYVTKHGDGAADLLPIGHLYKTQVRTLARALDVPGFVLEKAPTAGFLPGQFDRDDLGATYDVIDPVLRLAIEEGVEPSTIAARVDGVDEALVRRLLARHDRTEHKRSLPPTPVSDR